MHPASVRISKHYILASDRVQVKQLLDESERARTIEELFNFILPRIAAAVSNSAGGFVLDDFSILDLQYYQEII